MRVDAARKLNGGFNGSAIGLGDRTTVSCTTRGGPRWHHGSPESSVRWRRGFAREGYRSVRSRGSSPASQPSSPSYSIRPSVATATRSDGSLETDGCAWEAGGDAHQASGRLLHDEIARRLGRSASTVTREVGANGGPEHYDAWRAHCRAREQVNTWLEELWSPKEISGRLTRVNRPGYSGGSPTWERGWNHGQEADRTDEVSV